MDEADLALFESLTGAPRHVAEHLLEAHGGDVNSAADWYLESGGVGHGAEAAQLPASPPDYVEEPDDDEPAAAAAARRSRLLQASARPRSSPIEILDDDDEDIQVLASSMGRRRSSRVDDVAAGGDQDMHVGSVEEEIEELSAGAMGRRVRRNRRRMAGEVDRDLELLGQRFGVMDEFQPARAAQPRGVQQQQQQQQAGPSRTAMPPLYDSGGGGGVNRGFGGGGGGGYGGGYGGGGDGDGDGFEVIEAAGGDGGGGDDVPVLPGDVDLEEQRMLMAAIQGGGYEGQIPDFAHDPRYQQRVLSPGAQARRSLREEQDAAYHQSLQADKDKADAVERSLREAREAAAREEEAAAAEARRQQEEADRLERAVRSKAASLTPEPPADAPDAVNLLVRLPAGGRYSRRFSRTDSLQAVFDFVDVQSGVGGGIAPGSYSLATSYPRRVLQDGAAALTLADAGLSSRQEALFLELK